MHFNVFIRALVAISSFVVQKCTNIGQVLFRYLEFTGFYNSPAVVAKLENIDAPVKIIKVDRVGYWRIFDLQYLFPQWVIYLEIIIFFRYFYELESNVGGSRIGVELYNFNTDIRFYRHGEFFLAKAGKMQYNTQ